MLDLSPRSCIVPGMAHTDGPRTTAAKVPTMRDVADLQERNVGSTRSLLQRVMRVGDHLQGGRPPSNVAGAVPTPPGFVESMLEDAQAESALLAALDIELSRVEHACGVPPQDKPDGGQELRRAVEEIPGARRDPSLPLGGRYA